MKDKKTQYRMHKLMNCTDIEAFNALQNAGSGNAYFELLEEFQNAAPGITARLKAPRNGKEKDVFIKEISELQRQLFAIGSTTLLWMAEKAVEAAKSDNVAKCEEGLFNLVKRVQSLCFMLDEAALDPDSADEPASSKTPAPQPSTPKEEAGTGGEAGTSGEVGTGGGAIRIKAPVKPELFEKLSILIENFEMDEAVELLRSLSAFTYNAAVDSRLDSIYEALRYFDYAGAAARTKQLLQITHGTGSGDDKKSNDKKGKKKILAIDDVPDVLHAVKSLLKNDYTVYCVTNYMAALKFLTNNTPDLILLDIEMPDMDGFALLSIIRKIKAYEATPVLFLTANVSVENIKKAHNAGGNDFIKKPVDPQVLFSKIKNALAGNLIM